jgi:hypothetical protein
MSGCDIEFVGRMSRSEETDRGRITAGMLISLMLTQHETAHTEVYDRLWKAQTPCLRVLSTRI